MNGENSSTNHIVVYTTRSDTLFGASFFTKATAVVATLFIVCSLGLTIISRGDLEPTSSVFDKIEENKDDTPLIPENNN